MPPQLVSAIHRAKTSSGIDFKKYLSIAEETYRTRRVTEAELPLIPSLGLPSALAKYLHRELRLKATAKHRDLKIKWKRLEKQSFFEIDRDGGYLHAAAEEGVVLRESKGGWTPCSYAVLARAQLELREPAADITRTLDEYAALLDRTGFHLYEGELHELRGRLAGRESQETEKTAALQRARDCYTRFGMTAQAARVAQAMGQV